MSVPVFIEACNHVTVRSLASAPCPARAPRVSGGSRCRPSLDDPSHGRAQRVALGSSLHIRPDHRRDSDGWRDEERTPSDTHSRNGCPDLGPNRLGVQHPSSGLDTQERKHQLLMSLSSHEATYNFLIQGNYINIKIKFICKVKNSVIKCFKTNTQINQQNTQSCTR